ncbi:hypothetical protein BH11PLA1_BH11PLA1_04070 [soil metagenome]
MIAAEDLQQHQPTVGLLSHLTRALPAIIDPSHATMIPPYAAVGLVSVFGDGTARVVGRSTVRDDCVQEQRLPGIEMCLQPTVLGGEVAQACRRVLGSHRAEVVFQLRFGRRMWTLVWPAAVACLPASVLTISAWATCDDSCAHVLQSLRVTTADAATLGELERLNIRELDMLRKLGIGMTPREAARALQIPPAHVTPMLDSMLRTLGLRDPFQASLLAIWSGLVHFSDAEWDRIEFVRHAGPSSAVAPQLDDSAHDDGRRSAA